MTRNETRHLQGLGFVKSDDPFFGFARVDAEFDKVIANTVMVSL
jgi:hypothetical protein